MAKEVFASQGILTLTHWKRCSFCFLLAPAFDNFKSITTNSLRYEHFSLFLPLMMFLFRDFFPSHTHNKWEMQGYSTYPWNVHTLVHKVIVGLSHHHILHMKCLYSKPCGLCHNCHSFFSSIVHPPLVFVMSYTKPPKHWWPNSVFSWKKSFFQSYHYFNLSWPWLQGL